MTRFSQYAFVLFSSIVFIASCGGGGGGGGGGSTGDDNPTADQLKASIRQFSDISDAQGFVMTGDNPASVRPALTSRQMRTANLEVDLNPNSLYKVTPDGTLERVIISDDADEEITRGLVQPAAVRDIDQNYMVMYFALQDRSEQQTIRLQDGTVIEDTILTLSAYLVHKPTGLAYNMDSLGRDAGYVSCDVSSTEFPGSIELDTGGIGYSFLSSEFELNECRLSGFIPQPRFESDDQSNIYLRVDPTRDDGSSESYVFKIDTQNLGGTSITAEQLHTQFPLTGHKWGWDVDPGGEYLILQSGDDTYHLDIASGVFTNLELELATAHSGFNQIETGSVYRDLEGKMYVWGNQSPGLPHLFRVESVALNNSVFTDMGDLNSFTSAGSGSVDLQENMERMVINGTLLYVEFIDALSGDGRVVSGSFLELDAINGIVLHPEPKNQFANNVWTFATLSNGFFYYFGEYIGIPVDTVYRYNPATKTGTLFAPNSNSPLVQQGLEVSEVRVVDDNEVWFRAVRTSDSATVFGTMDIDAGTINITGTTDAAEPVVFIMEAILPSDFLSIDGSYNDWAIDLRVTTDPTNDGSSGHELTFLSHQQSATQFFALVEFLNNDIQLTDAATILSVDGAYEIVVRSDTAFIVDLSDDSETPFSDAGAISAIGQAVELSTPLSALTGISASPVVTVERVSLSDITGLSSSYSAPNHTVVAALPRALLSGETISIQLNGSFVLSIDNASATLTDTSGPTDFDVSAGGSFNTTNITVIVPDTIIGATALTPSTEDQLDFPEDDM